ncbi:hypothetical protein Tco_0179572 [Tanacetum coccineum]
MTNGRLIKANPTTAKDAWEHCDAYFRKIESVATFLHDLRSPVSDDDIVTYDIHGLSDKFAHVASIIAHQESFPNLDTMCSMGYEYLLYDESGEYILLCGFDDSLILEDMCTEKARGQVVWFRAKKVMNVRVKMDDPNITMKEVYRCLEKKARRRGKVYNWETATYGKIWDNEDVHDLESVETEFPSLVFNDTLTSEAALSCEPTVSSLNNDEIDFRISFDESDDEDCMIIFNKNSFSYKIISVNDLKMDSENDDDKFNMPLFPSPKPTVCYFDDLDFFKDFKNEFPAIVYNDA